MSDPHRKRPVLIVTRNYPPLLGGMERLNSHLVQAISEQCPVLLCAPSGAAAHAPPGVTVLEVPLRPLWRFFASALPRVVWTALRRRPGLVVGGSGLVAPLVLLAALCGRGRSALYLHGLDVVVRHPGYQLFWLPCIRRAGRLLCNSRHTAGLARRAGATADRIVVVHPGTALVPMSDDARPVPRSRVMLSVGRLAGRKGLAEFVTSALPSIVRALPDAELVVVGSDASDALLGSGDERGRIEAAARSAGLERHVRFAGRCSDEELAAHYRSAGVHVFPVRELEGDVEGFGMVALEAASHGLPTVAFASGGVPDAVSEGVSGYLLPPGDYAAFARRVIGLLAEESEGISSLACRRFAAKNNWDRFARELRNGLDLN